MKNSALIIVDYSNDFVAGNGKLTYGLPGHKIESYIVVRIEAYNKKQANIFFLMILHYEENSYHPEYNLFTPIYIFCPKVLHYEENRYHPENILCPPRNIIDNSGREFYGKVNDIYENILFNDHVHYLDKTRYDSFCGTFLDIMLRERNITNLEIV